MRNLRWWAVAALCGGNVLMTGTGCSKKADDQKAASTGAKKTASSKKMTPAEEAADIFKKRCTVCHGEKGTGDGPGAAALKVKPRNYTDAKWQASVKDPDIKKIIVKGGAAVGKDPAMPGNPDLEKKPEVVDELVKKIRSFRK